MKRILFVDDEAHVLESLRDVLRPFRHEWEMQFAGDGAAALEHLGATEYDVVVSDMIMPGMDGAELLGHVRRLHPSTVRIVLSGYAEVHIVARAASVAHRFLAKPCDAADLKRVIERSCSLRTLTGDESLRSIATAATRLPCVPQLYGQILTLLGDPDASLRDIGAIVEQDLAMAAKVLQLANSAFFGRARRVSRVDEAVNFLGVNPLKALILSAGALESFQPSRQVEGFSIVELQRQGARTAQLARKLVADPAQRDDAFAAALLHDLGLLVLLTEQPDYLADCLATATREQRPLVDVERELRGITHAEIGAHLLELWGLPDGIVEAVAFHHRPADVHDPILDATAAVSIADGLLTELDAANGAGGPIPSKPLDLAYLEALGVADRLLDWRDLAVAASV
jgi:HD-like signal output (HDOD) protein